MLTALPEINYIFVILPERTNNEMYSMVKELESDTGVITQCIRLGLKTLNGICLELQSTLEREWVSI